jgi:hypothetical protein
MLLQLPVPFLLIFEDLHSFKIFVHTGLIERYSGTSCREANSISRKEKTRLRCIVGTCSKARTELSVADRTRRRHGARQD